MTVPGWHTYIQHMRHNGHTAEKTLNFLKNTIAIHINPEVNLRKSLDTS